MLDLLNANFIKLSYFFNEYSIDEKMIKYFGKHSIKQFIQKKPIRFGFKEWSLCCSKTEYTFDFDVYQDASKNY